MYTLTLYTTKSKWNDTFSDKLLSGLNRRDGMYARFEDEMVHKFYNIFIPPR
jgi:hypothetical protein